MVRAWPNFLQMTADGFTFAAERRTVVVFLPWQNPVNVQDYPQHFLATAADGETIN